MPRTRATDILKVVLLSAVVALPAALARDITAGTSVQASSGAQCVSLQAYTPAPGVDRPVKLATLGHDD